MYRTTKGSVVDINPYEILEIYINSEGNTDITLKNGFKTTLVGKYEVYTDSIGYKHLIEVESITKNTDEESTKEFDKRLKVLKSRKYISAVLIAAAIMGSMLLFDPTKGITLKSIGEAIVLFALCVIAFTLGPLLQ